MIPNQSSRRKLTVSHASRVRPRRSSRACDAVGMAKSNVQSAGPRTALETGRSANQKAMYASSAWLAGTGVILVLSTESLVYYIYKLHEHFTVVLPSLPRREACKTADFWSNHRVLTSPLAAQEQLLRYIPLARGDLAPIHSTPTQQTQTQRPVLENQATKRSSNCRPLLQLCDSPAGPMRRKQGCRYGMVIHKPWMHGQLPARV